MHQTDLGRSYNGETEVIKKKHIFTLQHILLLENLEIQLKVSFKGLLLM